MEIKLEFKLKSIFKTTYSSLIINPTCRENTQDGQCVNTYNHISTIRRILI